MHKCLSLSNLIESWYGNKLRTFFKEVSTQPNLQRRSKDTDPKIVILQQYNVTLHMTSDV